MFPAFTSQTRRQIHPIYWALVEKAGVNLRNAGQKTILVRVSSETDISLDNRSVDMDDSVSATNIRGLAYFHEGDPVPSPSSWAVTFGLFRVGFSPTGPGGEPFLLLDAVRLNAVSNKKGLNALKSSVKMHSP